MKERGATRPMALDDVGHDDSEEEADEDPLVTHHRKTLWVPWALVLIGCWLLLAPFTFGYLDSELWVEPSGGRGAWFSDSVRHLSLRAELMVLSDVVSGALLVVLGWRALRPDRPISRWAACFVGIWLVFAPIVLWSPTAAGYANDSFIGLLVIALTILIPGMPNMVRFMQMGPATPEGWSYNPSTWAQRAPLIGLGLVGMLVSRYLGAYQLGYIDHVWDPFFGFVGGTQEVLDSDMSHMWPVSDAGLGGVAYTFEFLMGFMGAKSRWRTMPWMVTMFGILVIPLGLSHIVLVMSQPVVVHHWSTLALFAAAVMLPMITLTVDEVVAMGKHVRASVGRGDRDGSAWKVFWLGGSADGSIETDDEADFERLPDRPAEILREGIRGATAPWPLVALTIVGCWLLTAPAVLGISIRSGAADVAHIGGAAVVVAAVIAMGEPARSVRLLAGAAGVGMLILTPMTDVSAIDAVTLMGTAVVVIALAVPRGRVRERYSTWQPLIR